MGQLVIYRFDFLLLQNRDSQSLLPLTVKQINEALLTSDDKSNFSIDGVDVNNVCFLKLSLWFMCLSVLLLPSMSGILWVWIMFRLHLWEGYATELGEWLMLLSYLMMGLEGLSVTNGESYLFYFIFIKFLINFILIGLVYFNFLILCWSWFFCCCLFSMHRVQEFVDSNEVEGILYVSIFYFLVNLYFSLNTCVTSIWPK